MRKHLVILVLLSALGLTVGVVSTAKASFVPSPGVSVVLYATPEEYQKATGKRITSFNEAPQLKELVSKGQLPPVERRLPKDYMVYEVEEIGQYGGDLKTASVGPRGGHDLYCSTDPPFLFTTNAYSQAIIPYIAKGYDISEDKRRVRVYLREGLKWSDGTPFTADDIMFWWNDIIMNEELTPVKPKLWMPGGKLAEFRKLDDYAVEITFAVPYRPFSSYTVITAINFRPAHYLKKWHVKYNPDADKLAKQENFDAWYRAFGSHNDAGWGQQDTNIPGLGPWVMEKLTTTQKIYSRNPYFMGVDQMGNQLPYADRIVVDIVANREIVTLKLLNGELTVAGYMSGMTAKDVALYKTGEEKGNYHIFPYTSLYTEVVFSFNQAHPDPVMRKIFQDVRFRQAMSLALNREEINDYLMAGTGVPTQATVHPTCTFYRKEWSEAYAKYDPEMANRLLDEMGLKRGPDGYRLRPDGKTLAVVILFDDAGLGYRSDPEFFQLMKSYWEAIGIKTEPRATARTLIQTRALAGELDIGVWSHPRLIEGAVYYPGIEAHWKSNNAALAWGIPYAVWYDTGGKSGEEPPAYIKEFFDAWDRWCLAVTDEDYKEKARALWDLQAKNLYIIGTVGYSKWPLMIKNDLRNAPKEGFILAEPVRWWVIAYPEQWFFKK
ncbi:MAG: ABC transporter substrate-binding protein [bacterium]